MTKEEVFDIIKDRLKTKTPFLLNRLGDGEYLVMSKENIEYVSKRQWNHVPDQKDLDLISKMVADAYTNCDIVGVPTQYHVEKCGSSWASAEPYLNKIRPITKSIPTCSIDIHSEFLHSGLLNQLLFNRDRLIYISGRELNKELKNTFNIGYIQSYIVNPEQKWEETKKEGHWPNQFNECVEWIKSLDATGTLCLVGSGVLGKHYASLLKEQGGVVFEIGHVFDSWAGLKTRSTGKGVGAIDETYKL